MVAIWFGIIERQGIHRGAFGDVPRTHHRDPHLHHRLAATIEPTPSSGPETPRKSSRKPTVAKLQTGTTTVD